MVMPIVINGGTIGQVSIVGDGGSIKFKTGPDLYLYADPQLQYESVGTNQLGEYEFAPVRAGFGAKFGFQGVSRFNSRKRTVNCEAPTHVGKSRFYTDTITVYGREVFLKQCADEFKECLNIARGSGNEYFDIFANSETSQLFERGLQMMDIEVANDMHFYNQYENHALLSTVNTAGTYKLKQEEWESLYTMLTEQAGAKGLFSLYYDYAVSGAYPNFGYQIVTDGSGNLNYTDPHDLFNGILDTVAPVTYTSMVGFNGVNQAGWFDVSKSVFDLVIDYYRVTYNQMPQVFSALELGVPNELAGGMPSNFIKFGSWLLRYRPDHEEFARALGKKMHYVLINMPRMHLVGSDLVVGGAGMGSAEFMIYQDPDPETRHVVKVSAMYESGVKIGRPDLGGGAIKFV